MVAKVPRFYTVIRHDQRSWVDSANIFVWQLPQPPIMVDTTCNSLDSPSTAPCQGIHELMAQSGQGMLKKECSGSFVPIKGSEEVASVELLSNCQGEGQIGASVEGSLFPMTMADTCTTKETMSIIFGGSETLVSGYFMTFCEGNSTSTQHFAGSMGTQPFIV